MRYNNFTLKIFTTKATNFCSLFIVSFFPDGDVSLASSYPVYISQLVRFARVCTNFLELKKCNPSCISGKLSSQRFGYNNLLKSFTISFQTYKDKVGKFGCICRKRFFFKRNSMCSTHLIPLKNSANI